MPRRRRQKDKPSAPSEPREAERGGRFIYAPVPPCLHNSPQPTHTHTHVTSCLRALCWTAEEPDVSTSDSVSERFIFPADRRLSPRPRLPPQFSRESISVQWIGSLPLIRSADWSKTGKVMSQLPPTTSRRRTWRLKSHAVRSRPEKKQVSSFTHGVADSKHRRFIQVLLILSSNPPSPLNLLLRQKH